MNFVHTESLPGLICVNCKKFLSQFPVYCHSGGPTCGRCPYPQNGIRNEAYEALAQKLKFPCCYNDNGCLEHLLPKDVNTHEKFCVFRKYNCPIICTPQCKWIGYAKDLLEHVESKHHMFLLNENSFEVDFINSHNENYLLPYGENLYIVNRNADSKKHTFFCTVSYIGSSVCAEKSFYKIIVESGNKSYRDEFCNQVNMTTRLDRDLLNDMLHDPISILAKIEVFHKEEVSNEKEIIDEEDNRNIDFELLRELECGVCMEYMIPPIHQCLTGHSLCKNCRESLKECPTCSKEFQNTQNFALAQVINHINYPCKHRKCKFYAKAREIKKHEESCIFSPYPCPLKDYLICPIELQFEDIYDHIVNKHYENLLELESVSVPFDIDTDDEIEDCFIIKYGSKLFTLHFNYKDNEFNFALQLIGPEEQSSQYRLEIDILDSSGKNHRAYFTRNCGPSTSKEIAFDEGREVVNFMLQQIEHLITDQLCFRVKIQKN